MAGRPCPMFYYSLLIAASAMVIPMTKVLKISSFSEILNAIILIVYTWFFTFVVIPIFGIALNCFKKIPLSFDLLTCEGSL